MNEKLLTIDNSCKTRKELSSELGMSPSSLYRRLKEVDFILPRTLITPAQQIKIYEYLGYKYVIIRENDIVKTENDRL